MIITRLVIIFGYIAVGPRILETTSVAYFEIGFNDTYVQLKSISTDSELGIEIMLLYMWKTS